MSLWRSESEDATDFGGLEGLIGGTYHYVGLVVLAGFVVWTRSQAWGRFIVDGEVLFRGNDPWYHYRSTVYVVEHFPSNMPFDPWTHFSVGTAPSQFGTIFDQLMATAALIVGLGDPSDHLIRMVMLFAPPIFVAVTLIPVYVMGRRLGGRFAGLMSASFIALSSGLLMQRSTVGFPDHHVAEVLFHALGVLGVMVAISVAEREKPIYELLVERNVGALRSSLGWGVLGGIAVGVYVWAWPPGIFLVGIVGVFFAIYLPAEYLRGQSPEPAAFAGAVSMTTAGVLNLATVADIGFVAAGNSLLQPAVAFAVAGWCVLMAWLARAFDDRDVSRWGYPATAVGVIAAGTLLVMVLLPSVFDSMVDQFLRVFGFWIPTVGAIGTVAEAQPLEDWTQLFNWHGLALFFAAAGALLVLARQFLDDDGSGEGLFVVIWFLFTLSAALTQIRFDYYAVLSMAVLSALPLGVAYRFVTDLGDGTTVEAYQVMTVLAILMLVVAPMFVFAGASGTYNPIESGDNTAPGADIVGWEDSLDWMDENAPATGTYANPDGEPLAPYGTFAATNDFDYSAGSYGVASWWDYGHWITTLGEGVPIGNPFQQGATDMAQYLLAQNESAANDILADIDEDDAKTRYTMIDWKMIETEGQQPVNGKYNAPTYFHPGVDAQDFRSRMLTERGQFSWIWLHTQDYYESTSVRLYRYHGSAVEPQPVVVDWDMTQDDVLDRDGDGTADTRAKRYPANADVLNNFENMTAAREFVEEDGTAQVGGIGKYPSEGVDALENYRLVQQSSLSAFQGQGYPTTLSNVIQGADVPGFLQQFSQYENLSQQQLGQVAINWLTHSDPAWTKVFERVPGATVEGTGPADSEVTAQVEMRTGANTTFEYVQHAQTDSSGEFTMTLPYSTEGYENWGPAEGHTNVSVRANGPYTISSGVTQTEGGNLTRQSAEVDVSEAAVIGEDESPIDVELTEETLGGGGSGGSSNAVDQSSGAASADVRSAVAGPGVSTGLGLPA